MFFNLFSTRARLDSLFRLQTQMGRKIDDIHSILNPQEFKMVTQSFQELKSAVEHATSVKQAALVLIKDMGDKLAGLGDHPTAEQLRSLTTHLKQHADELASAVEHAHGGGGHEKEEE